MICFSYSNFFLNLANKANIQIIQELQKGPKNVKAIVESLEKEQSAVSHSLKKLADCQIVHYTQVGRERIYTLNEETVIPLLKLVEEHVKKNCKRCKHV